MASLYRADEPIQFLKSLYPSNTDMSPCLYLLRSCSGYPRSSLLRIGLVYFRLRVKTERPHLCLFYPANRHISRVEPRGFEPLASAVQSQILNVAAVRWCSEIPANLRIPWWQTSCLFAVVRVGWCTTGVFGGLRARLSFLPLFLSFQSSPTVFLQPTPVVF
jgi:hypothetical protein